MTEHVQCYVSASQYVRMYMIGQRAKLMLWKLKIYISVTGQITAVGRVDTEPTRTYTNSTLTG